MSSNLLPYKPTTVQPADIKLKYNFYNLKVHEFNYPVVEEPGSIIGGRRDSTSSLKKRNALDAPPMKETTLIKTRLRCRLVTTLALFVLIPLFAIDSSEVVSTILKRDDRVILMGGIDNSHVIRNASPRTRRRISTFIVFYSNYCR